MRRGRPDHPKIKQVTAKFEQTAAPKMGTVTMHGVALANLLATPLFNGIRATFTSIKDRGGDPGPTVVSPEMQQACSEVRKVLDASGAKVVKKFDVSISPNPTCPGALRVTSKRSGSSQCRGSRCCSWLHRVA